MKTIICNELTLHNKLRASMLIEPSVRATGLMPRFYYEQVLHRFVLL